MIRLPTLAAYNSTPWDIDFSHRKNVILRSAQQKKRVAMFLYERADTSTFRYRCYNIYEALLQSKIWSASYFFLSELSSIENLLSYVDLLIVSRARWTIPLENFIVLAKMRDIRIIFDVDDCVFDISQLKTLTNTLAVQIDNEAAYDFWHASISRIHHTGSLASAATATNAYLGNMLTKTYSYPAYIIPNFLNNAQLSVSNYLVNIKKNIRTEPQFVIGYFSGTPSHVNDFVVVYPEIKKLLEKYSNIVLLVVGFMDFPGDAQALIEQKKIIFNPLVDFLELQRLIAQVDVNIVPLLNNTFTNCKSELKFFEAAIVNTITVATPIYSYSHCIRDGENGFLCKPGEWYTTIEKIYLNKVNVEEIRNVAHRDAIYHYSGKKICNQIEAAYNLLLK